LTIVGWRFLEFLYHIYGCLDGKHEFERNGILLSLGYRTKGTAAKALPPITAEDEIINSQ
jgi:hypothetical protein